jgi:arylsulfatase A-like enzyme
MFSKTASNTTTPDQANRRGVARRAPSTERLMGPLDVVLLSAWCGLAAGLLEVGARVSCRAIEPTRRLYMMSRHFVWLTPLANMVVFIGVGVCLAALTRLCPRLGRWLSARTLCALSLLPSLVVAAPRIFPEAWFILTLGIASWLVPFFRSSARTRRWLFRGLPVLVGLVLILAGSELSAEWIKERREAGRSLPSASSPSVLLIVLDTVRYDHLSMCGYSRPTTPALERMARKGVQFDAARAPAPWTLASHASFFTGRWPHELDINWATPLRTKYPMLAEFLGSRGYATAGIAANTYCSHDAGLDRGFTHFEDFQLPKLAFLRTAVLFEEVVRTLHIWESHFDSAVLHRLRDFADNWFNTDLRRDASSVNRGFLDWLAGRRQSARPFFVFLNYMDAHAPYRLADGATHRFGRKIETQDERKVIYDAWSTIDKLELPRHYQTLARDCYDNCIGYLDEQIGLLFEELERRDVLKNTLVVITSDHGEGFGEHDLFDHGESLYNTEIRVPLLIVPPAVGLAPAVVRQPVSLRDLPATVIDLLGLGRESPFPGRSLATLWRDRPATFLAAAEEGVLSELKEPNPYNPNHGRSPAYAGSLISLTDGDFVYIRNEKDGTERLFNERDDPRQLTDRAKGEAYRPVLDRFRAQADRIKPRRPERAR